MSMSSIHDLEASGLDIVHDHVAPNILFEKCFRPLVIYELRAALRCQESINIMQGYILPQSTFN